MALVYVTPRADNSDVESRVRARDAGAGHVVSESRDPLGHVVSERRGGCVRTAAARGLGGGGGGGQ